MLLRLTIALALTLMRCAKLHNTTMPEGVVMLGVFRGSIRRGVCVHTNSPGASALPCWPVWLKMRLR